jgi:hypothetical protein
MVRSRWGRRGDSQAREGELRGRRWSSLRADLRTMRRYGQSSSLTTSPRAAVLLEGVPVVSLAGSRCGCCVVPCGSGRLLKLTSSDLEMSGTTSLGVWVSEDLLVRPTEDGGNLHEPVKHVEQVALPP